LFRLSRLIVLASVLLAGLAPSTQAAGSFTVGTASTSLGTVLVGPTGLTLYTHAGDTSMTSTCTGGCATAWPPLTIPSGQQPTAGPGVTGLGTFVRPGGATQVTANGLPLYGWQGDQKPGDVTGQGIAGFSVARPKAATHRPSTTIAGSIRAGTTRVGPFLTTGTLVLPNGRAATVRFHLGSAFVGRSVSIMLATKTAGGQWSAFRPLTVRRVEADGYAYVFVHIHGSEAFRATYAGDAVHGPGTSRSVLARGQ
jgi:predicted lipoprotein with Yx(FWY)xxD motif